MGVQDFQEYIEKHCPAAVVPVELQRLARGALVEGGRQLRLLLDAESCLHRLYGGSYTDWVSGGQWNHMLSFLAALSRACLSANIQFVVCFNGALEKSRVHEWVKRQMSERQTAQQIVSHVHNKGTPPPKVWFLPPVCMTHCVRLALLRFGVEVVQTVEDHHLEVLALFRKNGFHGLVAYDSDYALSNISHYFSSQALKLSRNGKSITTSQFLLQEVAKHLNIQASSFAVFAALLGNHILLDEDLAAFYWTLLGPEHPLASLKVRCHQLVLPPSDVVIRAVAVYVCNIKDITDLDAIAKDVFKNFQSCTQGKEVRFRRAVEYYSAISISPSLSPHAAERPNHFEGSVEVPIKTSPRNVTEGNHTPLYERVCASKPGPSIVPLNHGFCNTSPDLSSTNNDESLDTAKSANDYSKSGSTPNSAISVDAELEDQIKTDLPVSCDDSLGSQSKVHQTHIPSLLSMTIRSHMDITIPALPAVAPEVLRIAEHRHKNGLMYPYIYHVLSKGEIKVPVTIEDDTNTELPPAVRLFRPVRQYIYGVLFSLAEARRKTERLAVRKNCLPEYNPVLVKEWTTYKGKAPHTPELVEALPFREWTCPSLKKLWLGKTLDDKKCRMRAFLACMRSDTPAMLNPANIPAPFLVLCCILRFMLQWPGIRILRRNELDAFLAQALSPKLYEPEQLQELKIDNLDPRGIQLAALFMSGVDMAFFANDACGQPVPWEHCCPWMYFDGKLFQSKLIRANQGHAQLINLCDGQAELVAKAEKMRQSILEGLRFPCPPHPLQIPVPPVHRMTFYPPGSFHQTHPTFPTHRGRGQRLPSVPFLPASPGLSLGGKLEIAGTVVGQWAGTKHGRGRGGFPVQVVSVGGPNRGCPKGVISTPLFRTFDRGGYFFARAFKNQAVQMNKPDQIPIAVGHNANKKKSNLKDTDLLIQPHSALMCNTNPLLNALHLGGDLCQNESLEAAVLKEE